MIKTEQKLIETFNSIDGDDVKNAIIEYIINVANLSKVEKNQASLAIAMDNKSLAQFVGHKNTPYLAEFMRFLAKTESVEIKNKIMNYIRNII
jgi:hypothetical protein